MDQKEDLKTKDKLCPLVEGEGVEIATTVPKPVTMTGDFSDSDYVSATSTKPHTR